MKSEELSWWKFVEEYQKSEYQTVSLADFLIPNATGFRTPGSPMGMTTLNKKEWHKLMKQNKPLCPSGLGSRPLNGEVAWNSHHCCEAGSTPARGTKKKGTNG